MKNRNVMIFLIPAVVVAAVIIVAAFLLLRDEGLADADSKDTAQDENEVGITLVYAYQNSQWNETVQACVAGFEETHPDVEVSLETQYQDRVYEDALKSLIARDELGDIVQLKTPDAYVESGLLAPVSDDVSQNVDDVYKADGEVYGVGAVSFTQGILYNTDLFEKAGVEVPRTYGEFLEACHALEAVCDAPVGLAGSELWHLEYWMNHFYRTDLLGVSKDWMAECAAGERAWTDAEAVRMFTHLRELTSEQLVNEDWENTSDDSLVYAFSEEKIAMLYTGPWTMEAIRSVNPDIGMGWFYLPDEAGNVYAADTMDVYWSVTGKCAQEQEKYEAAMEFLEYFYSEENYTMVLNKTNCFSTCKQVDTKEALTDGSGIYQAFEDAAVKMSDYIGDAGTPQAFEEEALLVVKDLLNGLLEPEEAAARVQRIWEQKEG